MSLLLALIGGSTSGASIVLATTTGPAVFTANITVSSAGSKTIALATTTGPAVFTANVSVSGGTKFISFGTTLAGATFHATIPSSVLPDVVYLRVAASNRTMGVNFNRFPMVVPLITRRMAVGVERLPIKVPASSRLMRVA